MGSRPADADRQSEAASSQPLFGLEGLVVFVRGLKIQARIGMYPHERGRLQPLVVDAELTLRPAQVAVIGDTVNYEMIAAKAAALADQHTDLVETFAERLAAACLEHRRVLRVRVRVEKPEAINQAEAAGAEVTAVRIKGPADPPSTGSGAGRG